MSIIAIYTTRCRRCGHQARYHTVSAGCTARLKHKKFCE